MKGLLKIIRRYSLTAGLVIFVILFCNVSIFLGIGYATMLETDELVYGRSSMEQIGEELIFEEDSIKLSEKGQELFENTDFVWGMALDGRGNVVWDWKLPDEIPRSYTLQDVSVFSRWYLKDYPVRTWKWEEYLLVFGCDKEKIMRYDALISVKFMEFLPGCMKAMVIANLMIIVLFIFCFGFRFYRSMRPMAEGIDRLSRGEATDIPENGSMDELAKKINDVSKRLEEQQKALAKRDEARTEWVAGVSHDIRTPLSLIMGYSDKLAKDESLSKENRKAAENMKSQSLIIRRLIADLNLTSKLAYQAQPLKKRVCSPAAVLRECAAEVYNDGFAIDAGKGGKEACEGSSHKEQETDEPDFSMEIIIKKDMEGTRIIADEGLIKRALRNLIGNSIRHNGEGCHVTVSLSADQNRIFWLIQDTGPGIPEIIVKNIDRTDTSVHIMGLRLVSQIAKAHGGELHFVRRKSGNYDAEFSVGRDV